MRFICYVIYIGSISVIALQPYSHTATQQPYTTALQADDISNLKKGVYTMSRPPIPMGLKKKHKREYMRNLSRVLRRGLEAAEDHCLLSAVAMNLKRMIRSMG